MHLRDEPVSPSLLPETVLRYVLHAQESVVLDDASDLNSFSTDPYIAQRHARSVLCLPLTNQANLIGVLYLENNLAPGVFAPSRTSVLKLVASQAAISLENARLYRDVAERESKIRRLVDANIIGIFIWQRDGQILEANDARLHEMRIVGIANLVFELAQVENAVFAVNRMAGDAGEYRGAARFVVVNVAVMFAQQFIAGMRVVSGVRSGRDLDRRDSGFAARD